MTYCRFHFLQVKSRDMITLIKGSSKSTFQRTKEIGLNDLVPEILVKEKALKVHGSFEQIRRARSLGYLESQRLQWKVYSYIMYFDF